MLPNFLFLGPDKSGSTWLFELLRNHPQCYVPDCKDIYYFDRYHEKGQCWYESFFDDCPEHVTRVGEVSHDYLFSPLAAARIRQQLPDARLITILRHPVERTWSQYLYMMRNGYPARDFQDALKKYPFLMSNSQYATHLEHYRQELADGSLGVFWFEELVASPGDFASQILSFLGLSENPDGLPDRKVRPASTARNRLVARVVKQGALAARKMGAVRLVGAVKQSPLRKVLYRPFSKGEKPRMSASDRAELLNEFAAGIVKLETLTDRDLSDWKS